ncbi:MAG: type I DNA topoisomerase [Methyloligellaceae bacterium]
MNVVIVESPAKAKSISKYLGPGYTVMASYGHVRDLPSRDGSVDPESDFEMQWEVDGKSVKRLNDIARAVKHANKLILATDPDREGEAISWHVLQVLDKKKALKGVDVERVVFNAVTKQAVTEAMLHPREIDAPLVNAYLARRALDYLVGFTLSPVLWRKLPGSRSAGRVQSVALRIVCDREAEIELFKSKEYWSINLDLVTPNGNPFPARLAAVGGEKLDRYGIADEATASKYKAGLEGGVYTVASVESKAQKRNPAPPFTTSTLQQEASRKLGFSARQTMQVAQKLYEGVDIGGTTQGLITYMRTDGVQMISEAINACRDMVGQTFGASYLPDSPRNYKTKAKNAQEAHEAIRPANFSKHPDSVASYLDSDQAKLYKLIWRRAVASQMSSAELERTVAEIEVRGSDGVSYGLRANGSVVKFDGFLKLYEEGQDDNGERDGDRRLPALARGDVPSARSVEAKQHFTEPPPRFTEATLIKRMEELGIGRPSTYTSTLNVLRDREYVRLDKKRLIPEDKGRLVIAFLEGFFKRYVEFDFTASLEEKLDQISAGQLEWKDVLRDFWRDFIAAVDDIKDLRISEVLDALNEMLGPHIFPQGDDPDADPRKCSSCEDGRLSLKTGRFGAFIGCSNYPDCRYTRPLADAGEQGGQAAQSESKLLGQDPETGLDVTLRSGRFGPYVQLGEPVSGEKPKRSSVPKTFDLETLDLERALGLLALPREVGMHPETGKPIVAGIGRYGPFVQHDGGYATLDSPVEVFDIGLNRAVSVLAEKKTKGGPRQASVLKDLGEHPEHGGPVKVLDGRYGPYAKHGKVNATLPKSMTPEDITLEQAVELIAGKAAKGKGSAKKRKRSASGAKEAAP